MKLFLTIIFSAFTFLLSFSQSENEYKIMFYNVENLFDTFDDTLKNDEEFLPQGARYWTKSKYYSKLNQIYKVIIAVGEWNPPAIIGLSEIENYKVLYDLTQNTPLLKYDYKIIHKESPDIRGVDVGVIYRKDLFSPLKESFLQIDFPENPDSKTRDILYVKGLVKNTDTIHFFVNHWPSRWGGQLETDSKRSYVASVLKSTVDSILNSNPSSNIIITGDFNDYPDNNSLKNVLKAKTNFKNIEQENLYNISSNLYNKSGIGTHKHDGEWGVLDQFIVSGNLLIDNHLDLESLSIFNADFLLEPDDKNFGYKPKRTFSGYRYLGGFSDHLPTYIIFKSEN